MRNRSKSAGSRTGAATVEFAFVAPIVLVLFFGLIEMMTCNTAIHAMNHAAYEGARQGMLPGATEEKVRTRAQQLVQRLGYEQLNVTVEPSNLQDANEVTVTVKLSANEVGLATSYFVKNNELTQTVTLRRILAD